MSVLANFATLVLAGVVLANCVTKFSFGVNQAWEAGGTRPNMPGVENS